MRIHELIWRDDRVEHLALHRVEPQEVEEVCFGRPLILRAKASGKSPAYYVLGLTEAGRYLFCVLLAFPDGRGYPVTARPMTDSERQRFDQWRRK